MHQAVAPDDVEGCARHTNDSAADFAAAALALAGRSIWNVIVIACYRFSGVGSCLGAGLMLHNGQQCNLVTERHVGGKQHCTVGWPATLLL